jgi:predicted transcriptional regulator
MVGGSFAMFTLPEKMCYGMNMTKLSVILDQKTYEALEKQAKQTRKPCVRVAKEILSEGLARRDAVARRKKLAADYRAGRADARALLNDLESVQLELLDDEGA